jgi:hypothetical protein
MYLRHRRAPEFGEHTEDIPMNMLSLTWDDITELRERQIIVGWIAEHDHEVGLDAVAVATFVPAQPDICRIIKV